MGTRDFGAAELARQAALLRAAKSLNGSLDLSRVLVRICHEAAGIVEAEHAAVHVGDGVDGVSVQAVYGLPPEAIGTRLRPGDGLAGRAAARDEPVVEPGAAAIPLRWDGRLRGVLTLGWPGPRVASGEELVLLEAFAEFAAVACRNANEHRGLARAAQTDGLTGCLNHAAMQDLLRRELDRCRRTGEPLSFVLIDLDDFKRVNEEHGHVAGDELLRRVGAALRGSVRSYDVVARYGGDEFAVVAIQADELHACEVARRALDGLVLAVEGMSRAVEGLGRPGRSSWATAGVAEWDPAESAIQLIERADRALLHGKQHGRRGGVLRASRVPGGSQPTLSEPK